ncbi:DUF4383 domain-containing protein [Plantactinospora sp. WMMB334]|uniref:DUF4383 domain-containing protein n=1 Tax=Plantactinospora sp. WMMB334 TaxID=3404119 RepID=UPI003B92A042
MGHNPVNHPARPIYRMIAGLIGLYLVAFGVLGFLEAGGGEFFAQDDTMVLGQGTNPGNSVISIGLGLVILLATLVGRNVDIVVDKWLGYGLMALGLAGLAVLETDANYLNLTVATTIVLMILGVALLMAGMYGKVGSEEEAKAWRDGRLVL